MNVVVFGASGSIGSAIVEELFARGHFVTGVTRTGTGPSGDGVHTVQGDLSDVTTVVHLVNEADVLISAIGPSHGSDPSALIPATRNLLDLARKVGLKRVLVVGGAGGLIAPDGRRVIDDPNFPDAWKPIANAHIAAYEILEEVTDLDWTFVSPAAIIEAGPRTQIFRTDANRLIVGKDGKSEISNADYAIAFVDEIERPHFIRKKMTVGY